MAYIPLDEESKASATRVLIHGVSCCIVAIVIFQLLLRTAPGSTEHVREKGSVGVILLFFFLSVRFAPKPRQTELPYRKKTVLVILHAVVVDVGVLSRVAVTRKS